MDTVVFVGCSPSMTSDITMALTHSNVLNYATPQDAVYGLIDTAHDQTETGEWVCDVVYGPGAFERILAGGDRVLVTGSVIVAATGVVDTQYTPVRVVNGQPTGVAVTSVAFEVANAVRATGVVDVADKAALDLLRERLAV